MKPKKFHVICGMPRAGSTLLCNILNQNKRFYASSTSPLPAYINAVLHATEQSIDMKSRLDKDKEHWTTVIRNILKGTISSFYGENTQDVIFDKCRGWNNLSQQLLELNPESKMIVCVRDVKGVLASIEKQNAKTAILSSGNPQDRNLFTRLDTQCAAQGMVGHCIAGVMDMVHRNAPNALFLKFEYLSQDPKSALKDIYDFIGEELFEHDFNNIENTADDPDGFYLHKFPHSGSGKVEPCDMQEWKKFIPSDLAEDINKRFIKYQNTFSYI